MSFCQYYGDLGGHEVTIEVIGGSRKVPLSVIKLDEMDVTPSMTFDISESLH